MFKFFIITILTILLAVTFLLVIPKAEYVIESLYYKYLNKGLGDFEYFIKYSSEYSYFDKYVERRIKSITDIKKELKKIMYKSEKIDIFDHPETVWVEKVCDCDGYARFGGYLLRKLGYKTLFVVFTDSVLMRGHMICFAYNENNFYIVSNDRLFRYVTIFEYSENLKSLYYVISEFGKCYGSAVVLDKDFNLLATLKLGELRKCLDIK